MGAAEAGVEAARGIPDWVQGAGLMVAAYGAVLSTVTIILRQRDLKPHLKVEARSIRAVTDGGTVSPVLLEVRASNVGRVPVHLNTCGWALDRKSHLLMKFSSTPWNKLPHTLEPGRSFGLSIEASSVDGIRPDGTVRLRPWYVDDVGNTYYGRFTTLDLSHDPSGEDFQLPSD